MSFHPLEKFGFVGLVVAVLLPVGDSWPTWFVGVLIAIIAGVFLLIGQRIRHRETLRRLYDR